MAHAVGLDVLASAQSILEDLGHISDPLENPLEVSLKQNKIKWSVEKYKNALDNLSKNMQAQLFEAWGDITEDSLVTDGSFNFSAVNIGGAIIALQPERSDPAQRDIDYHDISRTPCHGYVAFYLWLQNAFKADAIIHIGAHGTLEWLPGKSVALSKNCWPEVLTGNIPVIYPFILNDPGEAAQAKRRVGALTIGHIPPALRASEVPSQFCYLESLLDEFSNADGLDPNLSLIHI